MAMRKKIFALSVILAVTLACKSLTSIPLVMPSPTPGHIQQFSRPTATPTPTLTPSPTPLLPSYVPLVCANQALATLPVVSGPVATPTSWLQANPAIGKDVQQRVFKDVVDVIDKVYVDPAFNGQDWTAIKKKYRQQVEGDLDTEAFYSAMESMVFELGDNHSFFLSPVEVAEAESELAGKNEFVGVGILILPFRNAGLVSVVTVFPDSPADKSGLKVHDSILAVDGLPAVGQETANMSRLRGPECSVVRLTVQTPGEAPREVMLVRQRLEGPQLIDARLVSTADGSRIGYIYIPTFFDETIPDQVDKALKDFGELDGLILDNRMNGGGTSDVLESLLSRFTAGMLGRFKSRRDSRALLIRDDPINNSNTVPLVVLVGDGTASFGEIFSGVLQDSGRAKIVGKTTDGNVEILHGYEFDDGSQLWIAEETFDPAVSHADWEATGIIPDVEAYDDWYKFTFETDPSIAAAVKLLGH
jgi:carboxyl-terminal processing protease